MSYYTATPKQAELIAKMRKEAGEKILIAKEFADKPEAAEKPKQAEKVRIHVSYLEAAVAYDELSVKGGDPHIWITRVKANLSDRWLDPNY